MRRGTDELGGDYLSGGGDLEGYSIRRAGAALAVRTLAGDGLGEEDLGGGEDLYGGLGGGDLVGGRPR